MASLKTILKMYAVEDGEVGYVQGMNLVAAAILLHVKEPAPCFVVFREVMKYGKLRQLYMDDFACLREEVQSFIDREVSWANSDLHEAMVLPPRHRCTKRSMLRPSFRFT